MDNSWFFLAPSATGSPATESPYRQKRTPGSNFSSAAGEGLKWNVRKYNEIKSFGIEMVGSIPKGPQQQIDCMLIKFKLLYIYPI